MLISALAALVMFAAPEATQAGEAAAQTEATQSPATQSQAKPEKSAKSEAKGPSRTCYNATPSGSRLPRKVCVTKAAESTKDDVEADKPN